MSILINIACNLLGKVKIPKKSLQKIIDEADTDQDGYISLEEVFYFVKRRACGITEKKV